MTKKKDELTLRCEAIKKLPTSVGVGDGEGQTEAPKIADSGASNDERKLSRGCVDEALKKTKRLPTEKKEERYDYNRIERIIRMMTT